MHPTRRTFLQSSLLAGCLAWAKSVDAAPLRLERERFGCLLYSFGYRNKAEPQAAQPERFVDFCREQGFGGVQMPLKTMPSTEAQGLRKHCEQRGMYLEGIITPPKDDADVARFEAELLTAKRAGVEVLRTVLLGGRRYEVFQTLVEYQAFVERSQQTLRRMAPLAERHQITLAVENHKDFRAAHLAQLLQRLGCEQIGVTLDTGNNLALLEDPWHVVDTLAPWTRTVHIKDMAVEESADGFMLAEVPLGAGLLDLRRIVERVTQANPRARFNLEMITRDPLSIPCLTDKYWATLGEVPALDLARTLSLVKRHARPGDSLPRLSKLSSTEQMQLELANVRDSVRWASGTA